jgi:hypothetical protein
MIAAAANLECSSYIITGKMLICSLYSFPKKQPTLELYCADFTVIGALFLLFLMELA